MSNLQATNAFVEVYKEPVEFTNQQLKVFWLPDEIKVEKDIQDILVNMTEAEKHGVITTLKLFTLYELKAGSEYWGGRFKQEFQRPEFQRMAATFSMFELAVHKPFYQKINELLHLHTDDFYNSYADDEVLKERIKFINDVIDDNDMLYSLAGFSFVEGAILYSSFAFLKHFQAAGSNKLLNIVRGINFSVRDENIHALAGAWVFKEMFKEANITGTLKEVLLKEAIRKLAHNVYLHECRIIDMVFEKGAMDGITPIQMKRFVESRINQCLHELGMPKVFEVDYNPIADWFYKGINGFTFNDTFSGVGNSYVRTWDEASFVYKDYK